jgi:hypothetical protein
MNGMTSAAFVAHETFAAAPRDWQGKCTAHSQMQMEDDMQELIDMLRIMAASCRMLAKQHPVGMAHAVQSTANGALPGIRAGIGNGVMLRITLERENNATNAEAENAAWNTLWVDPEQQQR